MWLLLERFLPRENTNLVLVIPYKDPSTKESDNDVASTMASTLPMVAVRRPSTFLQTSVHLANIFRCSHATSKQARAASMLKNCSFTPSYYQDDRLVRLIDNAACLYHLTISRASFVFAVQTWLAQTPEQAKKAGTPGYLSAGMACKPSPSTMSFFSVSNKLYYLVLGLATVRSRPSQPIRPALLCADQLQTYLPMFMPPPGANRATGTEAPPVVRYPFRAIVSSFMPYF